MAGVAAFSVPAGSHVAALVSGGVDSSVAVLLLKEHGITPDLYYIKIGTGEVGQWTCSEEEDWEMATAVARHFGCKLERIDLQKEYWERVIGYTIERLKAGLTPNPDVMCNRYIKFGVFDERVGRNYDFVATGHYAGTERDEAGRTWLITCPDPVKDQTDFLAQLDNWQMSRALFPIGQLQKNEVRRMAEREHLAPAHRKDSQGICFLGKLSYNELVRHYLGEREGLIVERETGNIVGRHKGYWFHTIGQRKGLGLSGGPWYVVGKDIDRNIVYVSHGFETKAAYAHSFLIKQPHFITACPFEADGTYDVTFKIRHVPTFTRGRLTRQGERFSLESERPVQGVAPGQFAVVYDAQHHRCYGSGEIDRPTIIKEHHV